MESSETDTGGVLWKKVFLEILQNSQENTCEFCILECKVRNKRKFLKSAVLEASIIHLFYKKSRKLSSSKSFLNLRNFLILKDSKSSLFYGDVESSNII